MAFFKKRMKGEINLNRSVKLGLALGGGGARGFAHIGALKAFDELGIHFDYLAGTSVGAIVASLYAFGKTATEIEEVAQNIKKRDVFKSIIPFLKPAKATQIEKLVEKVMGDVTLFSELKTPLCVVCTNLKTGKEVIINHGSVAKAVSGSAAVPGIYSPVVFENMHLIDGGLRNNVPADVVKKMGANVVFAIDVNHLRGSGTDSLSTVGVLSSTIGIMMQAKVDETLTDADLIFKPSLEMFSPLKIENINKMIKIGYDTVMGNREKIKKILELNPKRIGKFFESN
ncbi:MAG: patatin-like phospholipase family protein [Clostridia bacterium]|nr:patatin-like phospholipase family protein [Clostridia bacterium]